MPTPRIILPPKICDVCQESFERQEGQSTYHFKLRKTCSDACKEILRSRVQLRYDREEFVEVWNASGSVAEVARKLGITVSKVRSRASNARASGVALKILSRQLEFTSKTCVVCPKSFERRDDESATNFRKRQTCSDDCKKVFMSSARSGYDRGAFAELWNAADSVAEVASKLGITDRQARSRASNVRTNGFSLKPLYHRGKTIDVHGVQMTVPEFCAMTGLKVVTVLYRLRRDLDLFARPTTGPKTRAKYGYAIGPDGAMIEVEHEQRAIEIARQLHAAGSRSRAIAARLKKEGFIPRGGGDFTATQIRRMVTEISS